MRIRFEVVSSAAVACRGLGVRVVLDHCSAGVEGPPSPGKSTADDSAITRRWIFSSSEVGSYRGFLMISADIQRHQTDLRWTGIFLRFIFQSYIANGARREQSETCHSSALSSLVGPRVSGHTERFLLQFIVSQMMSQLSLFRLAFPLFPPLLFSVLLLSLSHRLSAVQLVIFVSMARDRRLCRQQPRQSQVWDIDRLR